MNKKAIDLSINVIVISVLALLVLVVMTFILTSQIPAQTKKYINITEEVEKDVTKDIKTRNVCEELFSNRRCLPLETCNAQGLINMGTDWRDCQQKATQGHTLYCCK